MLAPHITAVTPTSSNIAGYFAAMLNGTSFGGAIAFSRGKVSIVMDNKHLTMYHYIFILFLIFMTLLILQIDHELVYFDIPPTDQAKKVKINIGQVGGLRQREELKS